MIFVFDRVENIVGKGENAGYQHFLLFLQCFQKGFYLGSLKVVIAWKRVKPPLDLVFANLYLSTSDELSLHFLLKVFVALILTDGMLPLEAQI